MGRAPCCSKQGLNIGAWTKKEDTILSEYIRIHGDSEWSTLPQRAGLKRCGKSCRLRWLNYLRPDIKRGNISPAEVDLIVRLHRLLGNRWSLIAGRLPGRTDNEIKNYWNTRLSKKLLPLNDSQPNSITQNLMPGSKFHSPKQNHAFKTTPVKTTPVRYSGMLRPNPTNGYGDCNCSSDEAAKLCNGKETTNSSKSWSDRVVKDSITHDCSEHTSFAMADVNLHETAAGNSSCSTWSLAEEKLLHYGHSFARDAPALAESLWELNGLSSPDCLTYFGLEEFYSEPVTLMAAGTNQFEYMRSDQSNAQTINSFTVADDQIMDEL